MSLNNGAPSSDLWNETKARIHGNFESSGTKEKMVETTREELNQSDWADQIQQRFKDYLEAKNINASELTDSVMAEICNDLRDECRRTVPSEVKQNLLTSITEFVDSELKEVKKSILEE